ncbi:MAG: phosphatase PAP2 family protein [Clostridia bacterium]|nr:phosphatase PAP2 family protein [Clostridia bacterium]
MKATIRNFSVAAALLAAFVLWTIAVCHVDVQPIGPEGSTVGLATLNGSFHRLTGVSMPLYALTDWLGLIPVGIALAFALLGLAQWIRRKHILRVDHSLLVLGGFYLLVIAAYLLFEGYVVNRRPVLIGGRLEASYPSSTTLMTLCVIPTAMMQLHERLRQTALRRWLCLLLAAFAAFMVIGRVLSGVHWLSDIIGGALLSAGLVMLYRAVCRMLCH